MSETKPADDWTLVASAWDAQVDYVEEHSVAATEALLEALAIKPGDRVLELATGPGALASTWSRLAGPGGHVLISDIAPGMVDAARRRAADLDNVDVALLDASAIDLAGESFDVITCRMGLMFTPDPSIALGEIHRVLATDGRFGALTWGSLEHNPWMTCVGMAAMINGLVSGGPPVGPGGIFSLGDPAELAALTKGAGFVDVRVEEIDLTFRSATIDAHVERVSSLAGPMAAAFAAASDEQLDAVRRTAAQLAGDYITGDGVELPGRAILVAARRQ